MSPAQDDRDDLEKTSPTRPGNFPNRPSESAQEDLPHVDWQIGTEQDATSYSRPDGVVVGIIQFPAVLEKQANIQRALQLAWQAADDGAEIIVFHEMFMLPWVFDDSEALYEPLADTVDSPVWESFQMLANQKNMVMICPFYELGFDERLYNSALVIDADGSVAGRYRKRHLPPDNERIHYTVGQGPISAFPTRKGRIGVYICWDNFFPEGARTLALDNADIVFAPSGATDLAAAYKWHLAIQHNALVNGIPWVRVNRCELPFYPTKFVADAEGKRLYYSDDPHELVTLVEIDYTLTDRIRQEWPFLQDRRPDIYKRIIEK